MESTEGPPPRVAALSVPGRIVVAVTVGAVAVAALFHLAMVFVYVAPSNTLSKEHAKAINDYIYPEFEQNWKLFAPNPLQQNVHVEARAEVHTSGGGSETTGWVDMTAMDQAAMRHNPLPSHSQQNLLRRAWGFYDDTHGDQEQPTSGDRSDMSRELLLRIMEDRFGPRLNGGDVVRIQARAATTAVAQPPWVAGQTSQTPQYRVLPWWPVDTAGNTASSGQENPS